MSNTVYQLKRRVFSTEHEVPLCLLTRSFVDIFDKLARIVTEMNRKVNRIRGGYCNAEKEKNVSVYIHLLCLPALLYSFYMN
jgi:hypothetical protein